jgi:hypothetical protein
VSIYRAKKASAAPSITCLASALKGEAAPVNWAGDEGRTAPVPVGSTVVGFKVEGTGYGAAAVGGPATAVV